MEVNYQLIERMQKALEHLEEVEENLVIDTTVVVGVTSNNERKVFEFKDVEDMIEFVLRIR
jgi:hypothetical protein